MELVNWRNCWWYWPRRYTSVILESWELLNEDLVTLRLEISCICLVTGCKVVAAEVDQVSAFYILVLL